MNINIETHLRKRRDDGKKLLVPYLSAGSREDWIEIVQTVAMAGADAIEIGIPFSDPVMDGEVIQEANVRSLARGTTPSGILNELATIQVDVPLAVMTYYNLVYRFGHDRFAEALSASHVSGAILPDLPIEMASEWRTAANDSNVETIFLVAPNSTDERLKLLSEASQGFVYAISRLGVTGERDSLAQSALHLTQRVKAVTDKPVLVGVGVSNPDQAKQAIQIADGVVVGAALVRRMNEGASPEEIGDVVSSFRTAIDG